MQSGSGAAEEPLPGQASFSRLESSRVYMNNGTEGRMPDEVIAAYGESLRRWAGSPTEAFETDWELGKRQKWNRQRVARFLDVGTDNVCLTDNTTMGLNMVLMGLTIESGDKLVMTDQEHPAMISPIWVLMQRRRVAVEVRPFPAPEVLSTMTADQLLEWLFPCTEALRDAKALCVSHAYNTTGVRLPLDKLRRRADELNIEYLIVDGAQGLGMVDIHDPSNRVDNCDFYAAPMHKWMNGPPGTGLLFIRDRDLCPPDFYPPVGQKMGAYMCGDARGACLPIAEALQARGCSSIPGYVGAIRVIEFIERVGGPARVEEHILALAARVRELVGSRCPNCLISPGDRQLRSGLISFYPFDWDQPDRFFSDQETAARVVARLREAGVEVRYVPFPTVDLRDDCRLRRHEPEAMIDCSGEPEEQTFAVRVSTGYFNTEADLDVLADALEYALTGLAAEARP